jgi:hypothetical protein
MFSMITATFLTEKLACKLSLSEEGVQDWCEVFELV